MSQAMAPAGYTAIMSRLSGGPAAARAAAPAAAVPALEAQRLADPAPDELAERRAAPRAWAAFMMGRAFPELPTVLAASFVVLALALITAMLGAPRSIERAVPVAHGPAIPPATVGARANAQRADGGQVAASTPVLHPSAAPASAPSQAALRASYAGSSARAATARPIQQSAVASGPRTRAGAVRRAIALVAAARPVMQFAVVSGSLPRAVALRRVIALVASGLEQAPRVMAVSATRAVLYYGGSNSRAAAQALATRVRTLGYTAAVVTE